MYILVEVGHILICYFNEKIKFCSFENTLVEKSKSSIRNFKKWLSRGITFIFSLMIIPSEVTRFLDL